MGRMRSYGLAQLFAIRADICVDKPNLRLASIGPRVVEILKGNEELYGFLVLSGFLSIDDSDLCLE